MHDRAGAEAGVTFEAYRFEPSTGRLWCAESEVRLTPKAAAVLALLVARTGHPVTKEELFNAVWQRRVVGDDALTSCIQELRRALGDDARRPRFIETRHRRGYRFVAAVSRAGDQTADDDSIAVLPFTDMSPERDQDHLCEGLAEELINALTHVEGLRVAARSSSFLFRSAAADVRAVGRQLGVATLLEGSVRKASERVRITVQVIDAATGIHRWSGRFDSELGDLFAIQDEIAESVAMLFRGTLSAPEKRALRRPETASAPYEYYLRGRQHLPRMTQADLQRSREMFARAIELDAGYAPAWAGLAMVHSTLHEWFGANEADLAGAERASRQALELAPQLADSHAARGLALSLAGVYDAAGREFEEAIRINPNLFDAYYYYGRASFARGEIARSAELFSRAAEVRREDFQSPNLLAQSLRMLGRHEQACDATREALARVERVLSLSPHDERALSLGSLDLLECGEPARALEWSQHALQLYPEGMSTLVNGACLRLRLGLREEALELLERVFARGWGKRDWIEHDPDYDVVRDDPRFRRLLARLR